ncbi:DNA-binding transcriptional LysR family regulator [Kribbella italica]|uniref:DNA-binding transcriptional LysR family regulator n=1 Tax=Kribbella italica TaxID=1540520 RepID=A0A7W9J601_9ACTN|nr:DNA-binding transcriptional LysR family regulator [Kribbella italica]
MDAWELGRDRLVATVAPDHPLAGESAVSLSRLASEVFVDLPARTAGRAQTDQAFAAAGLTRDVAYEVTNADFIARLVVDGLGIALLPSAYVPQLSGITTIEVTDAPGRVEYVVWNRFTRTPAAEAFLADLDRGDAPAPRRQQETEERRTVARMRRTGPAAVRPCRRPA